MRAAQHIFIGLAVAALGCVACSEKKPDEATPAGLSLPPVDPTAEPIDVGPPPPADRT